MRETMGRKEKQTQGEKQTRVRWRKKLELTEELKIADGNAGGSGVKVERRLLIQ